MSSIENYPIQFIKRTREILSSHYKSFEEKDREATFLLNCLLGLIITVSENEQKKSTVFKGTIDEEFLKLIPNKIGFVLKNNSENNVDLTEVSEMSEGIGHKDDLNGRSQLWFINKIRNGIAHQHIEGVNEDGKWIGVRLWNANNHASKDFEIVFSIDELKHFAITLSDKYLNAHT